MTGRSMAISIKNKETEALARQLSALTGETLTKAIRIAVMDRLRRVRPERTLADELTGIGLRCARRPIVSHLTDDETLGYDLHGAPAR